MKRSQRLCAGRTPAPIPKRSLLDAFVARALDLEKERMARHLVRLRSAVRAHLEAPGRATRELLLELLGEPRP